jgi:putative DNA primase/helicase
MASSLLIDSDAALAREWAMYQAEARRCAYNPHDGSAGWYCRDADGYLWRPDVAHEVWHSITDFAREIRSNYEQSSIPKDSPDYKRAINYLKSVENGLRPQHIADRAALACCVSRDVIERRHALIAFKNGKVVDVHDDGSFHVRDATPGDFITHTLNADLDFDARAPRWDRFLDEITMSEPGAPNAMQRALRRVLGYALHPGNPEQKFAVFQGTGANGKSVLSEVVMHVFGDFGAMTPFSTFITRNNSSGHSDALMALENKLFVYASEGAVGSHIADDVIKQITGENIITGSRKYEKTRSYVPHFFFVLLVNELPRVDDLSHGFWRRVLVFRFLRQFDEKERDPFLAQKLKQEANGIALQLLLEYCAYRRAGLVLPESDAAEEWKRDSNPLALWMEDCLIEAPGQTTTIESLFRSYLGWHEREFGSEPKMYANIITFARAFWRAIQTVIPTAERVRSKRHAARARNIAIRED